MDRYRSFIFTNPLTAVRTKLAVFLLALASCYSCAQGNSQLLSNENAAAKRSIEEIQILYAIPEQPYRELGTVSGQAYIPYWFGAVDAENAAFTVCRKAAAQAGADAIIKMQLKVMQGTKLIYAEPWDGFSWAHGKGRPAYTIVFNGIAIKFE